MRWSCKVTEAMGMGPRSAWEEILVVAEATAKPQMSSTSQVRRQTVNFGGRSNHLGTWGPWLKYGFAASGRKLRWEGTQFVEFNKFPPRDSDAVACKPLARTPRIQKGVGILYLVSLFGGEGGGPQLVSQRFRFLFLRILRGLQISPKSMGTSVLPYSPLGATAACWTWLPTWAC